jgi:hypothetical protein
MNAIYNYTKNIRVQLVKHLDNTNDEVTLKSVKNCNPRGIIDLQDEE